MKIRKFLAAALLVLSAPAMSAPILENFNLGALDVPTIALIGNSFGSTGTYQDNYTFSINQAANAGALVLEIDPLVKLGIDVTSIALSGVGSFFGPNALGVYDFGTLAAGSYTLSVFSTVTKDWGLFRGSVGYAGLLGLKKTASTPVPTPGTLALLGLGLIGVAFAARRRASAN